MALKVISVVLIWVSICSMARTQPHPDYTVVQLTEHCRHGARTAFVYFPEESLVKKLGQGILTPNGHRMHYMLGKQIRKNYPSLFNNSHQLTNYDVELFASSIPRTQLSAISQLTGIFPFGLGENITSRDPNSWSPHYEGFNQTMEGELALPFGYKPFPLSIATAEEDFIFLPNEGKFACPNGAKLDAESRGVAYKKYDYVVGDLGSELEKKGFSSKKLYQTNNWDIGTIGQLASELKCYGNYYGKHPEVMDEEFFKRVTRFADFKFYMDFLNDDIVSYKSEMAAREFLRGMELVVNDNPNKRKFRLFSGHDTGLYPFTIRYNLTDLQCALDMLQGRTPTRRCEKAPPFAATYLYELAMKKGRYYVRILYNNVPFKFCDNNEDEFYCAFDEFRKTFTKRLFPDPQRFPKICGNTEYLNSLKTAKILKDEEDGDAHIIKIGITTLLILIMIVVWRLFVIKNEMDEDVDK